MTHVAQFRSEGWQTQAFSASVPQWDRAQAADPWNDVPVLASTVLGLELLLNEPVIDLRQTAQLILTDLGATLHTLRMAATDEMFRVEDCLASVEFSAWFDVLTASRVKPGIDRERVAQCWRHARDVARYARFVAESNETLAPETAYLAGLFHELHTLPRILGWRGIQPMRDVLPSFLTSVLDAVRDAADSPWKYVVDAAHQLTGEAESPCPLIRLSSHEDRSALR